MSTLPFSSEIGLNDQADRFRTLVKPSQGAPALDVSSWNEWAYWICHFLDHRAQKCLTVCWEVLSDNEETNVPSAVVVFRALLRNTTKAISGSKISYEEGCERLNMWLSAIPMDHPDTSHFLETMMIFIATYHMPDVLLHPLFEKHEVRGSWSVWSALQNAIPHRPSGQNVFADLFNAMTPQEVFEGIKDLSDNEELLLDPLIQKEAQAVFQALHARPIEFWQALHDLLRPLPQDTLTDIWPQYEDLCLRQDLMSRWGEGAPTSKPRLL